ncbi:MAG TPA: FAD-dependent monooxygenase [Nevskiaceae bacterium]
MQFHHHGYVSTSPRTQPAAGTGIDRPAELPDTMDVLIVGAGPAGHIAAAQLAQFAGVHTRIIERNAGRLELGHADGIQVRTVETFQAFGFANRLIEEAYRITTLVFWGPDPAHPENIIRSRITVDDPGRLSEFPHLVLNQARVQDYFAECMAEAPTRMKVDFGWEFLGLEVSEGDEFPVHVRLRGTAGAQRKRERTVRAKYVVGCDGARSQVRAAIGRHMRGTEALHAWGVMDVLAVTDFPDIRTKCVIQSHDGGNILLIPREGGYLFRMYVDAGDVPEHAHHEVRSMSVEQIVARANRILHPYTIEVRDVAWHSVYEVAQRLTDHFDDVGSDEAGRAPRVFITGDACHTHSAKAGQGMNVSMQDGFNIAWKLGHVLEGRSPAALLATYSAERQPVARELIDFDKQWSSLMAAKEGQLEKPSAVSDFFVRTFEFTTGLMTRYGPSIITGGPQWQKLATGWPLGARFHSAPVVRVCDANPLELGHQARADGRWRLYVFADPAAAGTGDSPLVAFADWLAQAADSPVALTPARLDRNAWLDVKVVYQQAFADVDLGRVPEVFKPRVAQFQLVDYENVFAAGPAPDGSGPDIFELRGVDRAGVVVVVRPDMYVAHILPLTQPEALGAFFRPILGA